MVIATPGAAASMEAGVSHAPVVVHDRPSREGCDEYVTAQREGSAYHSPVWLDVIHRAFGHDTRYLVAESAGAICGVLPLVFFRSRLFGRFTVSVPFVNYGGVLASHDEAARALLERAIDETRRHGGSHLELRHCGQQRFPELTPRRHKVAMELSLASTPEHQWQVLDRKLRNQVRKAEKSGLTTESGGLELLSVFYDVFARNMRDLGTPVYGISFFREVLAAFPDCARVLCVRHEGRPVAASIVHWRGDRIEVPWASALREFNALCPNVLLYWTMLRLAIDRRCTTFDFGRSTPHEGTYQFKKQWGAVPRQLVWEYWTAPGHAPPDLSPANPKFELAVRAWQRLPVSIATALGPHIVRSIP
jgi:FemAB-related protein (PEP-CTERM system-associated)